MISQKVYDLCQSSHTVSSRIADNPHLPPHDAVKELYSKHKEHVQSTHVQEAAVDTGYDLAKAQSCGKWGEARPSQLFLKASCSIGHISIEPI